MIKVDREEAEGQLDRLIEAATAGQDVVITTAGGPAVRLVPLGRTTEQPSELRDAQAPFEASARRYTAESEPSAREDDEGESDRRRRFFTSLNAAYADLRSHGDDWRDVEAERRAWDATLLDGLAEGERWDEDGGLATDSPKATGGR